MKKKYRFINSLEQANQNSGLYDNIKLELSYGKDFWGFHYTTLGFGNLLAAEVAAASLMFGQYNQKKLMGFYKNRIFFLTRDLKYWMDRSIFTIPTKNDILRCFKHNRKINDLTQSYIDIEKRCLHITTHLINVDKHYLSFIHQNILSQIKNIDDNEHHINHFATKQQLLSTPGVLNVGVHLRHGDFTVGDNIDKLASNERVPLTWYKKMINKIMIDFAEQQIVFEIFSDSEVEIHNLIDFTPDNVRFIKHSKRDTGIITFEKMRKTAILLNGNSTLSTWSTILSNQLSIFPGRMAAYEANRIFVNQFISSNDFLNDINSLSLKLKLKNN